VAASGGLETLGVAPTYHKMDLGVLKWVGRFEMETTVSKRTLFEMGRPVLKRPTRFETV
jgi:hypothetical protein